MKFVIKICLISFIPIILGMQEGYAQTHKKQIIKGNKKYKEGQYDEAEKHYSAALSKQPESFEGSFNKADALYKQKKYADAAQQFKMLAEQAKDEKTKAKAYHNLGNSLLQAKKLKESIDAYKKALRNNPDDDETRYNLALAKQMVQQQKQKKKDQDKKDQNKDQKDKKNENKDQKNDQQKNKDKKDEQKKKDQEKKDQQKKDKQDKGEKDKKEQQPKDQDEKKKQQQPQPKRLSKKDAARLLKALKNDEKELQRKLRKKKAKGTAKEIEKDW